MNFVRWFICSLDMFGVAHSFSRFVNIFQKILTQIMNLQGKYFLVQSWILFALNNLIQPKKETLNLLKFSYTIIKL